MVTAKRNDGSKRISVCLDHQTYSRVLSVVLKRNADRLKGSLYSMQKFVQEAVEEKLRK